MELAAKGQPDPGTWIPPLDTKDSKNSMESSSWQYRNIKSRARFPYRELVMSWEKSQILEQLLEAPESFEISSEELRKM